MNLLRDIFGADKGHCKLRHSSQKGTIRFVLRCNCCWPPVCCMPGPLPTRTDNLYAGLFPPENIQNPHFFDETAYFCVFAVTRNTGTSGEPPVGKRPRGAVHAFGTTEPRQTAVTSQQPQRPQELQQQVQLEEQQRAMPRQQQHAVAKPAVVTSTTKTPGQKWVPVRFRTVCIYIWNLPF